MDVIRETGGYNGKISFDGKEVNFASPFDALNAGIGMVHQEFSLIPGFKVSENIVLNRESTKNNLMTTFTFSAPAREQWSGQFGFLMAAIGSAIGLGNIWRFPGVAYSNGGGAFMIPYIVALLAVGVPVLLLDYALGHRYRGSSPAVFRRISRRFEWLG